MKISVLGTGCYNCLNLEMRGARLLGELGLSQVQLTWTATRRSTSTTCSPFWPTGPDAGTLTTYPDCAGLMAGAEHS